MISRKDVLLLVLVVALVVVPLFIVKAPVGTQIFGGADSQAQELATKLAPGYRPWFRPIWEPPSGEIASLLFALQAGLGTGFLGYYIGLRVGRGRAEKERSG